MRAVLPVSANVSRRVLVTPSRQSPHSIAPVPSSRRLPGESSIRRPDLSCSSVADDAGEDYAAVAARLNALLTKPSITGRELRELVFAKWGRTYDVRLAKLQGRMYLQVMWKFLEQKSFPLTEQEYMQQLDAVAEYLTEWGVVDKVKAAIQGNKSRGPGYTGGGNARCISIPLEVDLSGRRSEWN